MSAQYNNGEIAEFWSISHIALDGEVEVKEYGKKVRVLKIERHEEKTEPRFFYPEQNLIRVTDSRDYPLQIIPKTPEVFSLMYSCDQALKEKNLLQANILIQQLMEKFGTKKVKASSKSKADLKLILDGDVPYALGYQTKVSEGAADASILNASEQSRIRYKVNTKTSLILPYGRGKNKYVKATPKNLVQEILKHGTIEFDEFICKTFHDNVSAPDMLARLLLEYFSVKGNGEVKNLIPSILTKENFYPESKWIREITQLLINVCFGMVPTVPFEGNQEAQGGLILCNLFDSSIVIRRIKDSNIFPKELYSISKMDTASTDKHRFGFLYSEDEIRLKERNEAYSGYWGKFKPGDQVPPGNYFLDLAVLIKVKSDGFEE